MDRFAMQLYTKLLLLKQDFLEEERGAVDIVAIVVLIGIAVAIALIFRNQITGLITDLFGQIKSNANEVIAAP